MLEAIFLGLTSAVLVGPSGHNLFRIKIFKNRMPKAEFIGLLTGEFIYLSIALLIIIIGTSLSPVVEKVLSVASGLFLVGYSLRGFARGYKNNEPHDYIEGFAPAFTLALSNPILLLMYITILTPMYKSGSIVLITNLILYFVAFIVPTIFLLINLKGITNPNSKFVKVLENIIFILLFLYGAQILWRTL